MADYETQAAERDYPRAVPDAKASPMSDAFGRLNDGLSRIDDALGKLRDRTAVISHGSAPVGILKGKDEDDAASQHVREVRGYATRAHSLAEAIDVLTASLDV